MRGWILAFGLVLSACGASEREQPVALRAPVAGSIDSADEYPMVVGVMVEKGSQVARCSGALIAPNLVLTARHCVSPASGGLVECGSSPLGTPYPPENALVTRLYQMSDIPADYVAASRIELVPGGNDTCGFDLAALVLEGEGFGPTAAVAVPRIDLAVSAGEEHTAVGYGSTGTGGIGTRRFKSGLSVSCVGLDCNPLPAQPNEWIGEDDSFCQADSGAPALDTNDKVIGIISRGASPCAYPILANMSAWKSWIMELGVGAAADGGYEAPFWAVTGLSDPPPVPEAGTPNAQGQPCPCPGGFICVSPDGSEEHGACSASCSVDSECAAPMTCAGFGACVPPAVAPDSGSSDDGGCNMVQAPRSENELGFLTLVLLALGARSARRGHVREAAGRP